MRREARDRRECVRESERQAMGVLKKASHTTVGQVFLDFHREQRWGMGVELTQQLIDFKQ